MKPRNNLEFLRTNHHRMPLANSRGKLRPASVLSRFHTAMDKNVISMKQNAHIQKSKHIEQLVVESTPENKTVDNNSFNDLNDPKPSVEENEIGLTSNIVKKNLTVGNMPLSKRDIPKNNNESKANPLDDVSIPLQLKFTGKRRPVTSNDNHKYASMQV